ncbi:hypothetical protein [Undibacterium sp. RuRC25W]|uniref:hypothetical protein n=1 Tax=Undibacterium sp. RuRC25W TaxID=3413047 RepID=UPI003BF14759
MRFRYFKKIVLTVGVVMALSAGAAHAMSVMEFSLDILLLNSMQMKTALNMTKNQEMLWQQTEAKLRVLAHQRGVRREHLQFDIQKNLKQPTLELRDLDKQIEQEEHISIQENKQIRELCLTLNDALDDNQRQQVQAFVSEQLLMQGDSKREVPDNAGRRQGASSGSHSRGGSGMGAGATGSMGANGGNVQF